jgi:hypothetical protein
VFDLKIGATDDGIPPATGIFNLTVDVQQTRVLRPASAEVCFVDFPCNITWRPAEGFKWVIAQLQHYSL